MQLVDPDPDHATDAPSVITMYGADWCGDCIRAKAFFERNNVEYHYVDMVEHESATDIVLARNSGAQKIPVIIYPDNTHLVEPTDADLQQHLEGAPTDDDFVVEENRDEGRFELRLDGAIVSVADFSERTGGIVVVPHVGTDPQHRGKGYAGRIMTGLLENLRSTDRRIDPVCPYAKAFIDRHPEYHELLADN